MRIARTVAVLAGMLVATLVVAVTPAVAPPECTWVGTPGPDSKAGTPGHDVLCGRGGSDRLFGGPEMTNSSADPATTS